MVGVKQKLLTDTFWANAIFLFCIDFQGTDFPSAKHFLQSPQELHSVLVNAGSQQCESDSSDLLHMQDTPQQFYKRADFTSIASHTPQATAYPPCLWYAQNQAHSSILCVLQIFFLTLFPGKVPLLKIDFDNLCWKPALYAVLQCRSQHQSLVIRQDIRHSRLITSKYYTITLNNLALL